MLVKVAPLGERVVEVNVEMNTSVGEAIRVSAVSINNRSIRLNNVEADEDTLIIAENSIITLAPSMKGGKKVKK